MSNEQERIPGIFPGFERIALESEKARRIAAAQAAIQGEAKV